MIIVAFCSASSNNNLQLFFISHLLTLLAAMTLHSLSFNYKNINSSSSVWCAGYRHMTTKIWFSSVITVYLFIYFKMKPMLRNNKPFVPNPLFWWFHSNALCSVYTLWIHPLDLFQIELGVGFELVILMSESMKYHLCTTAQPCRYFVPFKY